jgi:hypothetical protein
MENSSQRGRYRKPGLGDLKFFSDKRGFLDGKHFGELIKES